MAAFSTFNNLLVGIDLNLLWKDSIDHIWANQLLYSP